jgi:formate--tetrahydrofolate ligase
MKSDNEIVLSTKFQSIQKIADKLNLSAENILPYGHDKAKVSLDVLEDTQESKLILVTAISPTPAGEGKTTTSIGLGDGLASLGESVCVALREPSLGPCMGVKGGATGGGYAQVHPSEAINLHFTGDFHAITSAHNMLAATIDNHIHHGNALQFNPKRILWPRVIDMNDRSLRQIVIGMGQKNGTVRETSFDITAASEIMAILCLSNDAEDLRKRLDRIIVGYNQKHKPIRAKELGVTGALVALLNDALLPNLVQTLEGTPVLIHGGPFANIAHGCNSVIATKMAMQLADYTVTEAGFGCDLGAQKFLDIKCVEAGLNPVTVVIVATVRALKMHGGLPKNQLNLVNLDALQKGIANLEKHIETIQAYGKTPIVAINRFHNDSEEELSFIQQHCQKIGILVSLAEHFSKGGAGTADLARKVIEIASNPSSLKPLQSSYSAEQPVRQKIEAVARRCYGADGVILEPRAMQDIKRIERHGMTHFPICIAKTQNSLSDNPKLLGRPTNFNITVRRILINAGAGFLVVLTGDIMRLPGLPKIPAAENIDVENGLITGIR